MENPPKMAKTNPDGAIVDSLVAHALGKFSLNSEILHNWQIELADLAKSAPALDSALLQDVFLQYPRDSVYFDSANRNALVECMTRLSALPDDIYLDFKLIVHRVVFQASTCPYTAKLQLHRLDFADFLVKDFLDLLESHATESLEELEALVAAKSALLTEFLDLGASTHQVKRLLLPLYAKSSRVGFHMKSHILSLLSTCFRRYPCQFDVLSFRSFASNAVNVPFNSDSSSFPCFTVSMWFKISGKSCSDGEIDDTAPQTLFSLSSGNEPSSLKVELINDKFIVTTGASETLTFNHKLLPDVHVNQGYSLLVLSYDQHQNLNLFIDGEYSESIPCTTLSSTENRWNSIQIGANQPANRDKSELLVKDLALSNIAQQLEWVNLVYHLGIGYDWSQRDFSDHYIQSLVSQLSPRNLKSLSFRLKELSEMKGSHGKAQARTNSHFVYSSSRSRTKNNKNDKELVFESLKQSPVRQNNVLFDSTDPEFVAAIAKGTNPNVSFHKPMSIYDSIFCWGGSGLLLSLIEAVIKDDYDDENRRDHLFLQAVDLLLLCLSNNRRLQLEFETVDGFWTLNMLVSYYKDTFNSTLSFQTPSESDGQSSSQSSCFTETTRNSLLVRFLKYACCRRPNSTDPIIADFQAFKFLVLNFGLYEGTKDMDVLLGSLVSLVSAEKNKAHNAAELAKMKITKRAIQHVKVSLLNEDLTAESADALADLLKLVVRLDGSVESVKGLAQFIVFALYHDPKDPVSPHLAFHALQALTDKLCGPSSTLKVLKKFSRSITIHWILLLLDFKCEDKALSAKVVCCAIALLAKFLRVLGPHIIRRFFHTNKGSDVLLYFLRSWWNNDSVMSFLFWGSFAVDKSSADLLTATIPQLAKDKTITQSVTTLAIPDFVILINKLALTGITILRQETGNVLSSPSSPIRKDHRKESKEVQILDLSFDVLHLINQLSDMIETCLADSPALQGVFNTKEWMETVLEVMTHLNFITVDEKTDPQLRGNFVKSFQRLRTVLSSIFVAKILDVRQIVSMLRSLNDITTKIVLDAIFPEIFTHINGFVGDSNFIYKETDFVKSAVELLTLYYHEFILQNYYIKPQDFETFINCAVSVIEISGSGSYSMSHLGPILGHSIILKTSSLVCYNDDENEDVFAERLDENVKFLLYKQALLLQPQVLSDDLLAQMIDLVMGNFSKLSQENQIRLAEHVLNFVRTASMIRRDHFDRILNKVSALSDYKNSSAIISEFFEFLNSRNDEDTVKHIQRFPTIKHIFNKNFHFRISKLKEVGTIKVLDMVQIVLHNGGALAHMNSAQFERFDKECQSLKTLCINGELMKYNRDLQDRKENVSFFTASYNSIKSEIHRLLEDSPIKQSDYLLDYIEGADRVRRLLVAEDNFPESERLTYRVQVPIKQIQLQKGGDLGDEDFEFVSHSFGNLSISENDSFNENDDADDGDANGESDPLQKGYEDRNRKVLHSLYQGDQIQALFNISKINGLDAVESLMVLGYSHVYFIENYFHCADGNVVDIDEAPHELRDHYLQFIKPQGSSNNGAKTHRTRSWSLEDFSCISRRKFLLRNTALELFFKDGASLLVTCLTSAQRDAIYNKLSSYASGTGLDRDLATTLENSSLTSSMSKQATMTGSFFRSKIASAFSTGFTASPAFSEITKKWKSGKISNFYYLMSVNTMAGRTCNDLTQYPVFPWVIADYDSEELDLCDPKTFRDLSKPMGAQTPKRAREFQDRYDALDSLGDKNAPPFHYGVHYSSAMIVVSFLIRLKPYVQSYLLLQGGKFDHADRLFNSIKKAWLSASQDNTSDVRELTPEFFYLPEFLKNTNNFELGKLQNGEHPNDVELPKWAKGDPKIFIAKNREALESPYVSANLHKWIDLIFGYRQTGPEAVEAMNVFHHSSYDGAINVDSIESDVEKRAVIGMINNFGQTPLQVFSRPHPTRDILNLPNLYLSKLDLAKTPPSCTFESRLHMAIEKLEISAKTGKWIGRPFCTSSEDHFVIMRAAAHKTKVDCGSLIVNNVLFANLQPNNISFLLQLANGLFVTGAEDGVIYVWKCAMKPSLTVSCHHVLRGHSSAIKSMSYSKTFNVCLSVDKDGGIILWDMTRFKFVRRVCNPSGQDNQKVLISISNDTGNFCTVVSSKYSNTLTMYTLNGEVITRVPLGPGQISAVAIACTNDSLVESMASEFRHSYWSNELIAVAYSSPQSSLQIHELQAGSTGWKLASWQNLTLGLGGHITTMSVFKQTETDAEEKLNRGSLKLVLGDSLGKVHVV